MLLDRQPRAAPPEGVAMGACEQVLGDGGPGHLECDITAVAQCARHLGKRLNAKDIGR